MKVERRQPTPQEWRSITSTRSGRRGIKATRRMLRALEGRRAKGERVRPTDREALRGESGERQITRYIELRHDQRVADEGERAVEQEWLEREREDEADRRALRKVLWMKHHQRLATIHAGLAQEHEARAERLASIRNGSGP